MYQNVVTQLQKAGFTNIKTETLDDLVTGWLKKDGEVEGVKVDDKTNFGSDTKFSKEAEIIITYHTFPKYEKKTESIATSSTEQEVPQQNKPDEVAKAALESTFPVENAKRAVVVAITNSYAADVFNADGNTYDVSKFHSYADTSGKVESYFFNATSWGTWSVKDEKAWHVDSLILKNILGTVANGSLDVKYDGNKYIVSNVKGTFGKCVDLSEIEKGKDASLFLTISPEIIKNDRNQTNDSAFLNEMRSALKIEKYLRLTTSNALAKFEQIKEAKRVEMRERNGNAKLFLVESMKNADIYVNGDKAQIGAKEVTSRINDAIGRLVSMSIISFLILML